MTKFQNSCVLEGFCAPFPLTPALSLRERENRCQSVAESYLHGDFAERPLLFPLLEGAGQGKGKQSDVRLFWLATIGVVKLCETFGKVEDFSRSL